MATIYSVSNMVGSRNHDLLISMPSPLPPPSHATPLNQLSLIFPVFSFKQNIPKTYFFNVVISHWPLGLKAYIYIYVMWRFLFDKLGPKKAKLEKSKHYAVWINIIFKPVRENTFFILLLLLFLLAGGGGGVGGLPLTLILSPASPTQSHYCHILI